MSSSQTESTCPSTPRGEEEEDLLYWMRAAERLIEAGEKGGVSKREWIRWGEYFDTLPGVGEHFRAILASRPERPRRPRKVKLTFSPQPTYPVFYWYTWW